MLLFKYLSREIWKNFILILLALTGLLLLTRLITLLVELSSAGIQLKDYFRLVIFLLPWFLTFLLPLAALLATIFLFMRLSQDQELLAFESLGIPFSRLVVPVLALAVLVLVLDAVVAFKYLPWSKKAFRNFLFELTERKIERGIPPKKFVSLLPGLSLFVEKAWGHGRQFAVVFMVDETSAREKGLIFAKKGELFTGHRRIEFHLYQGYLYLVSKDLRNFQALSFKEYIYRLDIAKLEKKRRRTRGEMSLTELKKAAFSYPPDHKKRFYYLSEYYQRLALPWAAFFLPLVGAPLGALVKGSGRGMGFFLAVGLYLGYYFLLSGVNSLAQSGALPPASILVVPNLVLAAGAGLLILAFQRGIIGRGK